MKNLYEHPDLLQLLLEGKVFCIYSSEHGYWGNKTHSDKKNDMSVEKNFPGIKIFDFKTQEVQLFLKETLDESLQSIEGTVNARPITLNFSIHFTEHLL